MGVEPTKDRLAAPPGFEVRTSHRGRFPPLISCSGTRGVRGRTEQVQPMLVHAAKITAAQCDAVAIEEFQNLDRNLAAVIYLVAELGGGKLALDPGRSQPCGDLHHLR